MRDWSAILRLIPGYDPFATAGDCLFDADAAERAIDFFHECLHHTKGALAGKPLLLEPWQQAIVGNLFGWKRPDGLRRYRETLIYLPRKNGKSIMVAGMALYLLFCDREYGAEIYSAAADKDQATLCFAMAKAMIHMDPDLERRAKIFKGAITFEDIAASYKPISADAETKHGYNTHAALIDELHAQRNRDLVDVLETSTGARTQPLIIHLTTADFDRPSICNEKHDYAMKVRDGILSDATFLPVLFEASIEDDWKSVETWRKANPNLGISVSEDYIARMCKRAQDEPSFENTFKRLHLNIKTGQITVWLPMDRWDACTVPDFDPATLLGKPCFAGLDLASTTDVAALALDFPRSDGAGHDVLMFFWIPADNAKKREDRDRVPYVTWARQGFVKMTEGNVIDYDVIKADLVELGKIYNIREIAVDRWNSTQLQTQLGGDGFTIVPFGQGFASMSAPSKELEKLVISAKLNHAGNPILRWMASNVAIETDAAANIKPAKDKSSEKIDGVVALVMALGRAIATDPNDGKSVYDDRGFMTL